MMPSMSELARSSNKQGKYIIADMEELIKSESQFEQNRLMSVPVCLDTEQPTDINEDEKDIDASNSKSQSDFLNIITTLSDDEQIEFQPFNGPADQRRSSLLSGYQTHSNKHAP